MALVVAKIVALVALALLAGLFWFLSKELKSAKHQISLLKAKLEDNSSRVQEAEELQSKFRLINDRLKQLECERAQLIKINQKLKPKLKKSIAREPLEEDFEHVAAGVQKSVFAEVRSIVHRGKLAGRAELDELENLLSLWGGGEGLRDYIIGSLRVPYISFKLAYDGSFDRLAARLANELIIDDEFVSSCVISAYPNSFFLANETVVADGIAASRATSLVVNISKIDRLTKAKYKPKGSEMVKTALDRVATWLCELIDSNGVLNLYVSENFAALDLGQWSDLESVECLAIPADNKTLEYTNRLLGQGALPSLTRLELALPRRSEQVGLVSLLLRCTHFQRVEEIFLGMSREDWGDDSKFTRDDVITLESMRAVLRGCEHLEPLFDGDRIRYLEPTRIQGSTRYERGFRIANEEIDEQQLARFAKEKFDEQFTTLALTVDSTE